MGAVEDIMAAVILMIILVVGGLIYLMSTAKDTANNIGISEEVFFDDMHINNFNNLLKINEPISGRSVGILMADAVYYRNMSPVFNNQTVNVTKVVEELLNFAYGNRSYYLEVKPRIVDVSLNFIVDGSNSLEQERQILSEHMKDIMSSLEAKLRETNAGYKDKDIIIMANIYILGGESTRDRTPTKACNKFNELGDSRIRCTVLTGEKLYLKNATYNTSSIFINNTEFNLDSFLKYYNMTPPFGIEWVINDTTSNTYEANEVDYYEADWGYGTAYASHFDKKTSMAKLTMLFPMGDELSTSSIPDSCFLIRHRTGPQEIQSYGDFTVCTLCEDICPVNRSLHSVMKGIQVAKDNNHVINPIYSYSCDYYYFYGHDTNGNELTYSTASPDYGWNILDNSPYVISKGFGSNPSKTWCTLDTCKGCTDPERNGNICFHPSCMDELFSQMQLMANMTGGKVIKLEDISTIDFEIRETINQTIEQYSLKIGEKHPERKRDVIETTQPLPNGQIIDLRMWVYKDASVAVS